jgi:hypothetical protein
MSVEEKTIISRWEIVVCADSVLFARVDDGVRENYPPVPMAKAAVYAAAIVSGLQPPRDIHPCEPVAGSTLSFQSNCPGCGTIATEAVLSALDATSFCPGCGKFTLSQFYSATRIQTSPWQWSGLTGKA